MNGGVLLCQIKIIIKITKIITIIIKIIIKTITEIIKIIEIVTNQFKLKNLNY